MKSPGSTRHKLQQVQFRHLKREIRRGMSRRPENCSRNAVVDFPGGAVRICSLGSPESGYAPCDESLGGVEKASRCDKFDCVHSEQSIRDEMKAFFLSSDLGAIAARYPDVAALMWVLEEAVEVPGEEADEEPPAQPRRLPVWGQESPREEETASDRGYRFSPGARYRVVVYGPRSVCLPLSGPV